MMQRILAKWRLVAEAIDGMDDPQGAYLFALEKRVRRLEGGVERLGKRIWSDAAVRPKSADVANGTVGPSTYKA
jgi:hypothetical protein